MDGIRGKGGELCPLAFPLFPVVLPGTAVAADDVELLKLDLWDSPIPMFDRDAFFRTGRAGEESREVWLVSVDEGLMGGGEFDAEER